MRLTVTGRADFADCALLITSVFIGGIEYLRLIRWPTLTKAE